MPDPSTFADARTVLQRVALWDSPELPASVREHIERGCVASSDPPSEESAAAGLSETPKPGSPLFHNSHSYVIASNRLALEAAAAAARTSRLFPAVLTSTLEGDVTAVADSLGGFVAEVVDAWATVCNEYKRITSDSASEVDEAVLRLQLGRVWAEELAGTQHAGPLCLDGAGSAEPMNALQTAAVDALLAHRPGNSAWPEPAGLCLLLGGEPTVQVRGTGLGGRNQHLALCMATQLGKRRSEWNKAGVHVSCLAAGTDGTDGPTDAAGGLVDQDTVYRAEAGGVDAQAYIEAQDSYHCLKQIDQLRGDGGETPSLIVTGPTGTNVMDVVAVCLDLPTHSMRHTV